MTNSRSALLALGAPDWGVVALYFVLLIATGLWLNRRQRTTEDYFLASRSMPPWAVAISVLATALSAATFIGGPQQAYASDLTYLSASIGQVIAMLIVAFFFLPALYRSNVTTVYELLSRRYGARSHVGASLLFMLGRVMASGARIYIAAHALSFVVFHDLAPLHLVLSCCALALAGVLYTVAGGIATVIWTDVIQTVVFLSAVVVAFVLLVLALPEGIGGAWRTLAEPAPGEASKLTLFDWRADPSLPFTIWAALFGWTLFNIAAYGTDQDLVQRMLTCRSARKASWSAISSVLIGIPVTMLFMLIGLLLFVHDRASPVPVDNTVKPFLRFITSDLPPGVGGLLVGGIFAAGLSSLDSALNAMSSTFVNDIFKRARPGRTDAQYLKVARLGVAVWGVILAAFACACVRWQDAQGQTLIVFALSVMTFAYAPLLGVFCCAILTRRGTDRSALLALATGLALMVGMEIASHIESLGFQLLFLWRLAIASIVSFAISALPPRKPD